MKNILLTIQYDGSSFEGSQKQEGKRTVFGLLEEAVSALEGRETRLIASGRTDRLVHAFDQKANFLSSSNIPPSCYFHQLKPLLPPDIHVLSSKEMPRNFHARFAAIKKSYSYILSRGEVLHPIYRKYKGNCSYPLDFEKMEAMMETFCGLHSFSAFSIGENRDKDRVLDTFTMEVKDGDLIFHLSAPGFLTRQVRILVGAVLDVGRGHRSIDFFKEKLIQGSDEPVAAAQPASGLYLRKVVLDEHFGRGSLS